MVSYCSKKDSRLRQTELLSHMSAAVTTVDWSLCHIELFVV